MNSPRLLQTYLVDGTLEGIRIIDPEGDIKAYVIPRLKIASVRGANVKNDPQLAQLTQPALYVLLNADESRAYIGESENFIKRASEHLTAKDKDWWTLAVAIVSKTNDLEKGDVKYLESLAVERAQNGSMTIENSTIPARNTIHQFKVHKLDRILNDTELVLRSLGYDVLSSPMRQKDEATVWHMASRGEKAIGEFRGDQFILLAGSTFKLARSDKWATTFPGVESLRQDVIKNKATVKDDTVALKENVAFRSVSMAAGFVSGNFTNGWTAWKSKSGETMDAVIRRGES